MRRRDFDNDDGGQPAAATGQLQCRWCGKQTQRTTLAEYGARCFACFEAYLRAPSATPAWMADKRSDGHRAWAKALQAREKAGDRLTGAQRAMWRAAVQHQPAQEEAA